MCTAAPQHVHSWLGVEVEEDMMIMIVIMMMTLKKMTKALLVGASPCHVCDIPRASVLLFARGPISSLLFQYSTDQAVLINTVHHTPAPQQEGCEARMGTMHKNFETIYPRWMARFRCVVGRAHSPSCTSCLGRGTEHCASPQGSATQLTHR